MVYGIASVTPGKGVVVVQAASNGEARQVAATMMGEGDSLEAIMKTISENLDYEPQDQQYALLNFDEYENREFSRVKGLRVAGELTPQQV